MDTSIPCRLACFPTSVRAAHRRGSDVFIVYNERRDAHPDCARIGWRPAKVTHMLAWSTRRQAAKLLSLGLRPVGFHPPTEVRLSVVQATCPCPRCRQQGMRPHAVLHRLDLALERPRGCPGSSMSGFKRRSLLNVSSVISATSGWSGLPITSGHRWASGRPGRRCCTCVRRPPRW